MSNFLKWRIDIVKLSTEANPTEGIENGSTLYEVDTGKLYIYYKGTWYEQDAESTPEENQTEENQTENNTKEVVKTAPDERSEVNLEENK